MYESWVRYSVAVYLGLLMAGATMGPSPAQTNGSVPLRLHSKEPGSCLLAPDSFPSDRESLVIDDPDLIPLRY